MYDLPLLSGLWKGNGCVFLIAFCFLVLQPAGGAVGVGGGADGADLFVKADFGIVGGIGTAFVGEPGGEIEKG